MLYSNEGKGFTPPTSPAEPEVRKSGRGVLFCIKYSIRRLFRQWSRKIFRK